MPKFTKQKTITLLEEIGNDFCGTEVFPECPETQKYGDTCIDLYPTHTLTELPLSKMCPGCRAYYAIKIAQWQLAHI